MAFKVTANLTESAKPVNNREEVQQNFSSSKAKPAQSTYRCRDFKGEMSSVKGIIGKYIYIPKINEFSGAIESPLIRLICGDECKNGCIKLKEV